MENSVTVEVSVKPEPMDSESAGDNDQNDYNKESDEIKEAEIWIKSDPQEDESQDSTKKEDHETSSEADTSKVEEESQGEAYNMYKMRKTKATSAQLGHLAEYMAGHPKLATGHLTSSLQGKIILDQLWLELANELNTMGGPIKTVAKWKQTWRDLRNNTKKKAALNRREFNGDSEGATNGGDGPPQQPTCSDLEEKVVEVTKPVTAVNWLEGIFETEPVIVEIETEREVQPAPHYPLSLPSTSRRKSPQPPPIAAPLPRLPPPPRPRVSSLPPLRPPPPISCLPPQPRAKKRTRISSGIEEETEESKSKLQVKKRIDKCLKADSGEDEKSFSGKEGKGNNVIEENEQQAENNQLKTETPVMYSYEITKNIEIVTISEEERQKEYQVTMKSRQHMRHVCEHCALGFVLEQAYLVHMKVHAPESGEHECLLCHTRLKTADMLYRHRLRHFRRYRCLLCWTRFKDKDTAACHVMTDHAGQAFECEHCGRGFKRPQYLKRHVEQYHTKPLQLECGVCSRVFHEKGWYRSHIRTHNEEVRAKTVKLPATCEICSREFKNKANLKRHLLSHEAENVHCGICYEKCKNRTVLGEHYLKVHDEKYDGAPEETCTQCMRVCATRAMLKRHMLRMHSDRTKKYQCDHCQRLYLTKGEVRSHITWSHMPAEARGGHTCACGRMFRTPSLLRDHAARFHAPQPPPRVHGCDHCEKAFANKQVLNRHKKSHSNEMYPCNECGVLFKTQPYVKVHYQIKHLNMTRAQIKAQRKLNNTRNIQKNIQKSTNWEPPIANKKGPEDEKDTDPLLVLENEIQIKLEHEDDIETNVTNFC